MLWWRQSASSVAAGTKALLRSTEARAELITTAPWKSEGSLLSSRCYASTPNAATTRTNRYLTTQNGSISTSSISTSSGLVFGKVLRNSIPTTLRVPLMRPDDDRGELLLLHHLRQYAAGKGAAQKQKKRRQIPPGLQRPSTQQIVFVSPGILVEPWKKESEKFTWGSLLTVEGWRKRWAFYFVNTGKSIFALSKCMTGIPNFSLRTLKVELAEIYETINQAAAKGKRKVVQDNVTDKTWTLFKKEMMDRTKLGWSRIDWKLVEPVRKIELLQGRVMQVAPEILFVQLTCKIMSKQSLAAYDKAGELVAGSPDEAIDVAEYWVFERGLGKNLIDAQGIKWRLAARLGVD
mmetsp:Transcript_10812/g.20413  ORF Transcript_10812/g.20413 Transcript_10812/m.20413 type:complete len:349 (-) Transcript_10812:81-1127(-)